MVGAICTGLASLTATCLIIRPYGVFGILIGQMVGYFVYFGVMLTGYLREVGKSNA